MQLIAWAALGWLVSVPLEAVARRLAGEHRAVCPRCGRPEPGPAGSALLRAIGPAGPRCRGCGSWGICWLAGLGPALALVFGLLAHRWPPGRELWLTSLYAALLLLVAVLDLRHRLVYPLLTYPATALAVALTPLGLNQPAWSALAGGLAAAAAFLLFYLAAAALYRGGRALGFGDVMIAGLVGAMTGLPSVGGVLTMGTLFGGFGAVLVGLARRSPRADFAYGPALCLAGLLALLAGPPA